MFTVQGLMIWGRCSEYREKGKHIGNSWRNLPDTWCILKKWGPQTTAKLVYKSNNFGL